MVSHIYVFLCTLRSGIEGLKFQKFSTQDFLIPVTPYIYFLNKFQTRMKANVFFFGFLILLEETLHLTFIFFLVFTSLLAS